MLFKPLHIYDSVCALVYTTSANQYQNHLRKLLAQTSATYYGCKLVIEYTGGKDFALC